MFCNKCGAQLPDDAKFCGNCGNKFASNSTNEAVEKTPKTETAKKKKSGKKPVIILASIFGALLVAVIALCVVAFVFNGNINPVSLLSNDINNEEQGKDPRQAAFDKVINEYEQAVAWYNAVKYYHDTSSSSYSDNLKDYISSMNKSYPYFADFKNVPDKYFIADVDNDEGAELVVMDKSTMIATYMYDENYDTISFANPGDPKNVNTTNYYKANEVEWINFQPADMHVKLKGTIKVTTAKERAADPNAKCQVYNGPSGQREREMTLNSAYMPNDRYIIFQLDEMAEYPIRQLESVFPHKIWSIIFAFDNNYEKNSKENFQSWQNYNGKYVTVDIDLLKCDAPSGVTGYGNDISFDCSSDCVVE